MGTRITGGDEPKKRINLNPWKLYPTAVEIGCLNRSHREIVYFKIPRGRKSATCPVCGRRAGRA